MASGSIGQEPMPGRQDYQVPIATLGRLEDRPEWAEAAYLTVYHTGACYTIETPKPFPIEARVRAQIAAVETVTKALKAFRSA